MTDVPGLERRLTGDLAWYTDPVLAEVRGIVVAFSERTGGVSVQPYDSLDLAAHVGDDPAAVDENRSRLLDAAGLGGMRDRLTTSTQVHGDRILEVSETDAGAGAFAASRSGPPLGASDALLTAVQAVPLLMCYADCVPVVLVATSPIRAVAVVHAGWRGVLARLPRKAAVALAQRSGCEVAGLRAYIGPHICGTCFEVGDEVVSQFGKEFVTIRVARGRMDLGAVVSGDLADAGLCPEAVVSVGACTLQETGRFFSYRAERVTGRHGALAAIV